MKRLFGGILLGVGLLIMTCSGLCSLSVGLGFALHAPAMLLVVLIVGGLPFLLGYGAFRWGRSLLRQADEERF